MNERLKDDIRRSLAVADAVQYKETCWINPKKESITQGASSVKLIADKEIEEAKKRLKRFAGYLMEVFPETTASNGIIESELRAISHMAQCLKEQTAAEIPGKLYLKMDSHLLVAGSIKARGGIHEVLKHAEELALAAGMVKEGDDYRVFASEPFRQFFSQYKMQAGSTGNLGLSIGIMSAKLGFQTIIHMSADARQWKKELLRSKGVTVMEYEEDYCAAVAAGRKASQEDPKSYFVDDENSRDLFTGYAVAGARLKKQLEDAQIAIDERHPLFVYLPCGIGGAPGGVAYGLRQVFADAVHCFFAEPTHACCMLLGMATNEHDKVSVYDFGLDGKTAADGLAVGRPSAFVGKVMEPHLSGIVTVSDEKLELLKEELLESEGIYIEPSACASFGLLLQPEQLHSYIKMNRLEDVMDNITHIAWATGGSLVPESLR